MGEMKNLAALTAVLALAAGLAACTSSGSSTATATAKATATPVSDIETLSGKLTGSAATAATLIPAHPPLPLWIRSLSLSQDAAGSLAVYRAGACLMPGRFITSHDRAASAPAQHECPARLRIPGLVTRRGGNRPGVGKSPVCERLLTSLSPPGRTAAWAMSKIRDA